MLVSIMMPLDHTIRRPDVEHEIRRLKLKPTRHPDGKAFIAASILLQELHDEAPADHFTLGWLMSRLHKRSFGLIMLLLAVVAIAPGVSIVAGLLLMIPAFQMVAGQNMPVFPRRIAVRPIADAAPRCSGAASCARTEISREVIHPRWPTPLDATKRLVGAVVVLLNVTLLFTPVPLSNVVPALVIALISLAYLEEDGLLLSMRCWPASSCWRSSWGGLGDDPRREMDRRPLVTYRGCAGLFPGFSARAKHVTSLTRRLARVSCWRNSRIRPGQAQETPALLSAKKTKRPQRGEHRGRVGPTSVFGCGNQTPLCAGGSQATIRYLNLGRGMKTPA